MIDKLQSVYSSLTAKYKEVADFIIQNTDEFLTMNINDFARRIDVSSATISRFMKQVFGMTFPQVKVAFAKASSLKPEEQEKSDITFAHSLFQIETSIANNVKKLFADTIQLNPVTKISVIAKMIAQAENIYLFGIGASGLAVQDFAQKLIKLGKRAIFNMDANLAILNSSLCTSKDLVIAISYSGLTREVLIPAKKARSRGCPVVCITGETQNKLMNVSDYILRIPSIEQMIIRITAIYSRYGQFFLVDLLYMATMKEITNDPETIMESYKDLLLELK